jgi:methylenetetrahydrofolate dehydrogenase (NADP+)/methenyltetrahydrofolate cyclohydrolase
MKRCETVGVNVRNVVLPADVTQEKLLETVSELNGDAGVHGVLIFRPLPNNLAGGRKARAEARKRR